MVVYIESLGLIPHSSIRGLNNFSTRAITSIESWKKCSVSAKSSKLWLIFGGSVFTYRGHSSSNIG